MVATRIEVIYIKSSLSPTDVQKAQAFLIQIKPLLATNECQFMQNEKNIAFDRLYPLKHEQRTFDLVIVISFHEEGMYD